MRALKSELSKQKEEYEQKLRKWKINCEGMQIKYENAVSILFINPSHAKVAIYMHHIIHIKSIEL